MLYFLSTPLMYVKKSQEIDSLMGTSQILKRMNAIMLSSLLSLFGIGNTLIPHHCLLSNGTTPNPGWMYWKLEQTRTE